MQAVVVIWGEFPQLRHDDTNVTYLSGFELTSWLNEQPKRLSEARAAELTSAVRKLAASAS